MIRAAAVLLLFLAGPAAAGPVDPAALAAFRARVQSCWAVDPGEPSAGVVVRVGFTLGPEGRVAGEIRLIEARGADAAAQEAAFQSARRAILRCQGDGYDLPAAAYDSWREVEMTFDPREFLG